MNNTSKITKQQLAQIKNDLPEDSTVEQLVKAIKLKERENRYDNMVKLKIEQIINNLQPTKNVITECDFYILMPSLKQEQSNFLYSKEHLFYKIFNITIEPFKDSLKIIFQLNNERKQSTIKFLK